MARQIQTRWKIAATLKALTPLHIGGIGGDTDTDLALAVNGRGNHYIPGTSLAGALRGWMQQFKDENFIKDLWGDHETETRGASFIVVEDAEVELGTGQKVEIREGVGIDRHTGAAAERFKYSRAILPKGIVFPLNVTLDCPAKHDPTELWRLLQAIEQGDIRIGAAKTRGLGRVNLHTISVHRQSLDNAEGIFDTLMNRGQRKQWDELKARAAYIPPARLTVDIVWQPRDPVMVKAEGDGIAVDILPLVSQVESDVRFVIPGSSIKGVLRAHAERILRTVRTIDIAPDEESNPKFDQQIQVSLVDVLFGTAEKNQAKVHGKKKESQGSIGILSVDDCYATLPMAAANWSAVETATHLVPDPKSEQSVGMKPLVKAALGDAALTSGGEEQTYKVLQPAMHVAVDRWTGGAADGMLYSVLEPIGVTWEPIGLHLDILRLKKLDEAGKQKDPAYRDKLKPAISLLLLVLRDFANRKIPIGYGTNRGMGTVAVKAMTSNGTSLNGIEALEGAQAIASDLSSLGEPLLTDLTEAWQTWIDHAVT